MRQTRRTMWVLAAIGVAVLVVDLVSWTVFEDWREAPAGFLILSGVAAIGVVSYGTDRDGLSGGTSNL